MTANLVRCKLCGSDRQRLIKETGDGYFHRRIVECRGCGLAFVSPQPTEEELAALYDRMYHVDRESIETGNKAAFAGTDRVEFRIRKRLPRLASVKKAGTLLDVGANDGSFLKFAKQTGYDTYGVELSPTAAEYAARNSDSPVVKGSVDDFIAQFPDMLFDVVTLWDVVEHFLDPLMELKKINSLLKPGGILALSTVNRGSLRGIVYKDKWLGFTQSPEHIFFFTPAVMRRFLAAAGFKPLKVYGWMTAPVLLRFADWFKMGNILEVYSRKN